MPKPDLLVTSQFEHAGFDYDGCDAQQPELSREKRFLSIEC